MPDKKRKNRRLIGLIVSLVINLAIVAFIAVREFRKSSAGLEHVSVRDINLLFLLPGIVCFFAAAWADTAKCRRMLVKASGKDDRYGALECTLLGKYYDNITPFGAGGQPFQMSYLKHRGYGAGTSGAVPVVSFLTQQIAFILIAAVVFIANRDVLDSILLIRITAYVGLGMYALLPICLLLFAVFPRPFMAVLRGLVRFGAKLRLIKDREKAEQKATKVLTDYIKAMRLFCGKAGTFIRLILLSCVYQFAVLSIPFFMLRAFGGSGDWWTTFSLVVYIYAAITIIPTPGNSGAAEGSFYAVFASLEGGMLFWAMISWRILVYYSWLLCGLIMIAFGSFFRRRCEKKQPAPGKPLRAALFVDIYYPKVDGVVRTVDAYAKNLQTLGHDAFVVSPKEAGAAEDAALPYRVYRTPSLRIPGFDISLPLPCSTRELRRAFKESPPDVIHVHSPFFLGRLALRLGKKYHIPVYATFHSKYYDDAYNITHSKLLAWILVKYVVNFYTKVDRVWACSRMTADTLRSYGYNGTIYVMENGVDMFEVPQDLEDLRQAVVRRFELPTDRPLLLFVGQQIWHKNLRLVLDTVKRLSESDTPCRLVSVGEGYDSDAIQAYSRELGLDDCVRFVGKVANRELLFGLYAAADLLFFPSVYDNAPLVVREAALAGLPSLLAEGSNAAEIITDGVNGYAAETTADAMAERIRRIFSDREAHETVARNAKETIPVSWNQIVARAVTAYRTNSAEGHVDKLDKTC
ncbi:MAG: flippase-like domain-containing protein [Oscillospiraceae bacterium]|nr:flippase-like domain-containing protein [Oscillospiraceae bacterium]